MIGVRVEHIPGVKNIWADMLTRPPPSLSLSSSSSSSSSSSFSGAEPSTSLADAHDAVFSTFFTEAVLDSTLPAPTFKLPSWDDLVEESANPLVIQQATAFGAKPGVDGVFFKDECAYVPPRHRLGVFLTAHVAVGGHRGVKATRELLSKYVWEDMDEFVKKEIAHCLHCLRSKDPERARPFGDVVHGAYPTHVLHIDFVQFPESKYGVSYVCLARDDVSGYVFVFASKSADAAAARTLLLNIVSSHSFVPAYVVSDQGSHFHGVFRELLQALGIVHHEHLEYTPQANGTIERTVRTLVDSLRKLLSDRGLDSRSWVDVLPLAVLAINNSPSERLNGLSPAAVFTGRPALSVEGILTKFGRATLRTSLSPSDLQSIVDSYHAAYDEAVSQVVPLQQRQRDQRHARRASLRHVHEPDFEEGDFVLISVAARPGVSVTKLSPQWQGPARVVGRQSPNVFVVQLVGSDTSVVVHARHLQLFHKGDIAVSEELIRQSDQSVAGKYIVESLLKLRQSRASGQYEALVRWAGYGPEFDTWEPLTRLHADAPVIVEDFLATPAIAARKDIKEIRSRLERSEARRDATRERRLVRSSEPPPVVE